MVSDIGDTGPSFVFSQMIKNSKAIENNKVALILKIEIHTNEVNHRHAGDHLAA